MALVVAIFGYKYGQFNTMVVKPKNLDFTLRVLVIRIGSPSKQSEPTGAFFLAFFK